MLLVAKAWMLFVRALMPFVSCGCCLWLGHVCPLWGMGALCEGIDALSHVCLLIVMWALMPSCGQAQAEAQIRKTKPSVNPTCMFMSLSNTVHV